ncbi:MAG: hypothetical protein R3C52_04305 [Hyphomonadaceae bacterium]
MTLDVRGGLKNTKRSHDLLTVADELLSNSIDAYLIRRDQEPTAPALYVTLTFELFKRDLEGRTFDLKLTCVDNGAGLGDAEVKAFVTKDTSFKDDLRIEGLGKCKGTGRIQYFHFFKKLSITSVYRSDIQLFQRDLRTDESVREIEESSFVRADLTKGTPGTKIILDGIKDDVYGKLFSQKDLRQEFAAHHLRHHFLISFLHRLVSIQEHLGDFEIHIVTKTGDAESKEAIKRSDLPTVTETRPIDIVVKAAADNPIALTKRFVISHYKLDSSAFDLSQNVVALCANSSPVKRITKRYLKTVGQENRPLDGFYHLVLIEAEYLDQQVNEQRDDFRIPDRVEDEDLLLDAYLSMEEIYDAIDPEIREMLAPPDWDRDEVIDGTTEKYGISRAMIADVDVRLKVGDTEEQVARRVLKAYQDRALKDTTEMFDLKEKIVSASPDAPDFREKLNEMTWKFASSLKNINMANLSQLVVRRAWMLDVLRLAVTKTLAVQQQPSEKRRKDERLIHSVFFPMGRDSDDVQDHDIWILSEEYQYYDYIASDKQLAAIKWDGGDPLFESDIDAVLAEVFAKRNDDNGGKRPDIAIFSKQGAAIIVEFKAPGVNLDEHTGDLSEYAHLLAAKSKGKLKQFYGYLIGTTANELRLAGYTEFPSRKGWFATHDIRDPATRTTIGELYSEILFYDDIVDKAAMRLQVYKERLRLD